MKTIKNIEVRPGFMLSVVFDNGINKIIDFKPYFRFPVFEILHSDNVFASVRNGGYFIEWPAYEIDLSADTLWNDGTVVANL